ncbi:hypothetical protein JM93_01089 [Roseibium hamelinense]|uniref:CopG family transcriptional regulator n=1 Tax=Roseibium hamelinense TaxID=150831 RepID=A0A562T998_9HYPH|nr:DUF411 domain-containing protein [Roseibium hamelinense]MTI45513.1 DUF411 domain-containing protein [Roseibium hamelinense]TWI90112.1 hypothetical protein JM93_01089 [Roseibium hamelinense]
MTLKIRLTQAALTLVLVAAPAAGIADENTVTVFKTPWCGCCHVWAEKVQQAGYSVVVKDMEDLSGIKKQAGIPDQLQACHTAVLGSERKYILEGHVPLEAMHRLISEQPDIRGVAVAGMPMGSLGMDYDAAAKYPVHELPDKAGDPLKLFMQMGEGN